MLRLSVNKNEYLMVGQNVRITFLGGNENAVKLMIDAPKEINVARGKAIAKRAAERAARTESDCVDGIITAGVQTRKGAKRKDADGYYIDAGRELMPSNLQRQLNMVQVT